MARSNTAFTLAVFGIAVAFFFVGVFLLNDELEAAKYSLAVTALLGIFAFACHPSFK